MSAPPPDATLRGWLDEDGRTLADALRGRGGDRDARRLARAALAEAFAVAGGEESSVEELIRVLRGLREAAEALAGRPLPAIRPLAEVWVRRPMPDRILRPRTAAAVTALGDRIASRMSPPMALSEERIAWMEARCAIEAPGLVRPIRSNPGEGDKLVGGEVELLRKRGRSPFS